jgi:hypothetical protein
MNRKVVFFSREGLQRLQRQQYSVNDVSILKSLGLDVIVASGGNEAAQYFDSSTLSPQGYLSYPY